MKTALIIPLHKQSRYWDRLLMGIRKQSTCPDVVYLVIDRPLLDKGPLDGSGEPLDSEWDCIDEINKINAKYDDINIEILVIKSPPVDIARNTPGNIFLAGMARNIGLEKAIGDGCDVFVFIDGDCIPQRDLISSHIKKCNRNLPVLSVGRRRESKYRWQDMRESVASLSHLDIFRKQGILINRIDMIEQCLIVWSCNIALNLSAINRIKKFNDKYYQRSEVFSSDFLGAWGGEDSFLGIEAWICRLYITTVGESMSGVEHIDHPRPESTHTIKHKEYYDDQCNKLKQMIRLNPLDLDFF